MKATETKNLTLTAEDLKTLKAPFPREHLGVKVQSLNKERTRAMLVLYLQHTDVQDRIEEVDPAWSSEVTNEERIGDTVYVRLKITIKGVARENVGEGADPKSAYSDALKRSAMLFGVGRYLYDSPTVWIDYTEAKDRYKQWTIDEYDGATKPARAGLKTAIAPKKSSSRSREQLNRTLMNLYRPYLTKFPETRFVELLQERYSVGETRLMTVEQMEDLVKFMEEQIQAVA